MRTAGSTACSTLDERRRAILPELEALRGEQNAANDAIAAAKREGSGADDAIARMREVAGRAKGLAEELATVDAELAGRARAAAEPARPGLARCRHRRARGRRPPPALAAPRDHLELAGPMIDMEHAARLSGSRFAYLRGDLVFLELALVRWTLELLRGHGFEPVIPPVLVREEALYGTGFLPDTEQQIYALPEDELYLVGTSEVALASLHAGEIIDAGRPAAALRRLLPVLPPRGGRRRPRHARHLPRAPVRQGRDVQLRRAVGSRRPSTSGCSRSRRRSSRRSGSPYRVVDIAIGDLGNSAARKFDCEAWIPSQEKYRELTSTSNTTDYQARRLEIRWRPPGGGRPETLHTLNGTAVAVGRTIIALLENGQRDDGTVVLPEALTAFGAPASLAPAASLSAARRWQDCRGIGDGRHEG